MTGEWRLIARPKVRQPFPWPVLLEYLKVRLIPGVEAIREDSYWRRHRDSWIRVSYRPDSERLAVYAAGPVDVGDIKARVARLLIPEFDGEPAQQQFRHCPILGPKVAAVPGLRPLGCWDPFELCLRTIVGQQVTVAAAGTLSRRLVERCGQLTPAAVLSADLAGLGMPGRRVDTLVRLAAAVESGDLELEGADWPTIDAGLARLSGIGPWTRNYLAIRLGREPDAMPLSDIGLLRATGSSSPKALEHLAESWRPWRAYAATWLWCVP